MQQNIRKQSGHAAILFALFIPILFGVFTLGTDGARAVQDKARLLEAVEVASLAVAGQGSDDVKLAKSYIEYYFPLAKVENKDISIIKLNCEDNPYCRDQDRRFFEYQVTANITQPTWFPGNEAIIGFGDNYQVSDASITRKYHSETVDVVLVADFSGSMAWPWEGEDTSANPISNPVRYMMMKEIISEITDELEKFNQFIQGANRNRLAVTGFDFFTSKRHTLSLNKMLHYDHLICNSNRRCNIDCRYDRWGRLKCDSIPGNNSGNVDALATIDNIFNSGHWSHSTPVLETNINSQLSFFLDIDLTNNFSGLKNQVNQFIIRGSQISGTSSYAGIIRAAQIAKSGSNPRRLIILLSDGEDTYRNITDKLIDAGLCSRILNNLNSEVTQDGRNVTARMVAVGFAYDINAFPQMKNCVGQENVFSAQNRDAIKNKILELITEEIGHLAR
ncbi:pilus assembly protein TadG-related protein [Vibrio cincinnatiensis]